ncbi:MAG: hypothetical protein CUN55_15625 [Phototrophicales bacterium]|nr:MAG: hypothetical protein CUN55_15625 [Phototrophicales bacterium]
MRQPTFILTWTIAILIIASLACNLTRSNDTSNTGNVVNVGSGAIPTVTILNRPTTAVVNVPLELEVEAQTSSGSITSVELYVNQVFVNRAISSGANPFRATLTWTPRIPGTVELSVIATSNNGVNSAPQTLTVTITTNTTATQPAGSGGAGNATVSVPPSSTGPCRARMTTNLRFRSVPDTSSSDTIIRVFNINEEAAVQGRLGDNSWFQVLDSQTGQLGWIFYNNSDGDYFTLVGSCINVPVVSAPVTQTPIPTPTTAPTLAASPADIVALPITGNTELQLVNGSATGSYSLRIRNDGGANTGPFKVLIVLPGGEEIVREISNLAPNQTISVADGEQQNITFTTAGLTQISVFADFEDTVPELNEGNNFTLREINVSEGQ